MNQTTSSQAVSRVKNAGTVNLIMGITGLALFVLLLGLGVLFIAMNTEFTDSSGGEPMPSAVLGIFFLVIGIIFTLPAAIVNTIAGIKMRKGGSNSKGWTIYTVVMGSLTLIFSNIFGILQLVFGILALTSVDHIDHQAHHTDKA